jgi:hypothetical protein
MTARAHCGKPKSFPHLIPRGIGKPVQETVVFSPQSVRWRNYEDRGGDEMEPHRIGSLIRLIFGMVG